MVRAFVHISLCNNDNKVNDDDEEGEEGNVSMTLFVHTIQQKSMKMGVTD